LQTDA